MIWLYNLKNLDAKIYDKENILIRLPLLFATQT